MSPPDSGPEHRPDASEQARHALRVLEFDRVIARLGPHCETPIGAARCAELLPVFEPGEVWERLALTEEAHALLGADPPPSLAALRDPRGAFDAAAKGGELPGVEAYRCGSALRAMRALKGYLSGKSQVRLARFAEALPEHAKLEERVLASLESDGAVNSAASPALAALRAKRAAAAKRVVERIQSYLSGRVRDYLSDPIYTVRDGRYVLPVKAEHRSKVRGIVHDTSASGATLFVEPVDVLNLANGLRELESAEREEERRILRELSGLLGEIGPEAIGGVEAAGAVDAAFARARLAYADRGSPPQPAQGFFLALQAARHPLLDQETVVPLDIELGERSGVLITGPNTGGKTVAIKTAGLAVAMAQSGLFPPATHMRLGPFAGLWADIGDEQSLQQSLSTFSGHMKNVAEALRAARPGALTLFDELGAGTDPAEGAALAVAILRRLREAGCAILASTHFGELKAFAYSTEGFTNAAMEFDPKTLRPTYRLLMGAPGSSQALRIAERFGVPKSVIEEARAELGGRSADVGRVMEELERGQRLARTAQGEADRRLAALRKAEVEVAAKLAEADERRATVARRGAEAIEAALREIRLEAADVLAEVRAAPAREAGATRAKGRIAELETAARGLAADLAPAAKRERPAQAPALAKGMRVLVEGYAQVGTLLSEPSGKSGTVMLGSIRFTAPISAIRPAPAGSQPEAAPRGPRRASLGLARAAAASTELHLRRQRAEEAEAALAKFLDDALLAGLPSVRIVHGKGEGVLRSLTRELLRAHPQVAAYRDGEPGEGGNGVTVAQLK